MSKKFAYIKMSQTLSHECQRLLIQRQFACVLTLCFFFLEVGKNLLMTASKVRHSPFFYQIFPTQVGMYQTESLDIQDSGFVGFGIRLDSGPRLYRTVENRVEYTLKKVR